MMATGVACGGYIFYPVAVVLMGVYKFFLALFPDLLYDAVRRTVSPAPESTRESKLKQFAMILGVAGLASISTAQSMNIDFNWPGGGGVVPSSPYGAAGSVGEWNNANIGSGVITNFALVDLGNAPTTSLLNLTGFSTSLAPGSYAGDALKLMEDTAGSSGGAVLNITGLLPGNYNVFLYGQSASGNVTSTFIINSVSQASSGGWAGSHVLGNSYVLFSGLAVTGGSLTVNYTGNFNGAQLQYGPVPEPMTILGLLSGLSALGLKRNRQKQG